MDATVARSPPASAVAAAVCAPVVGVEVSVAPEVRRPLPPINARTPSAVPARTSRTSATPRRLSLHSRPTAMSRDFSSACAAADTPAIRPPASTSEAVGLAACGSPAGRSTVAESTGDSRGNSVVAESTGDSGGRPFGATGDSSASWSAADPSLQKSAARIGAGSACAGSAEACSAPGPIGTSSSRGPSQSTGSRTTLVTRSSLVLSAACGSSRFTELPAPSLGNRGR